MTSLSLPQLSYLQTSLSSNTPIRPDSRSLTQFRPISYASSILPGCLGSVHLTWGPFSIIIGVKGEIVPSPSPTTEFHVEVQGERDDDPLTTILHETMTFILKSALNMTDLKVSRGRNWQLYIDAVVSHLALKDTRLMNS